MNQKCSLLANRIMCGKQNSVWQTEFCVANRILCGKQNSVWQTGFCVANRILCFLTDFIPRDYKFGLDVILIFKNGMSLFNIIPPGHVIFIFWLYFL